MPTAKQDFLLKLPPFEIDGIEAQTFTPPNTFGSRGFTDIPYNYLLSKSWAGKLPVTSTKDQVPVIYTKSSWLAHMGKGPDDPPNPGLHYFIPTTKFFGKANTLIKPPKAIVYSGSGLFASFAIEPVITALESDLDDNGITVVQWQYYYSALSVLPFDNFHLVDPFPSTMTSVTAFDTDPDKWIGGEVLFIAEWTYIDYTLPDGITGQVNPNDSLRDSDLEEWNESSGNFNRMKGIPYFYTDAVPTFPGLVSGVESYISAILPLADGWESTLRVKTGYLNPTVQAQVQGEIEADIISFFDL